MSDGFNSSRMLRPYNEYLVFYITPSEGKNHLRKGLDSLGAGRWESMPTRIPFNFLEIVNTMVGSTIIIRPNYYCRYKLYTS